MRVGSCAKQCSSGVTSAKLEGARPALYQPMYHRREGDKTAGHRGDVAPADVHVLALQLPTQPTRAHERLLKVQFVDAAHQVQLGRAGRARQADHRTAADAQSLGLTRDGQSVVAVDHGFALSNPALVSAWAVPTKTSAAPSSSCRCQSITWLACGSKP